MAIAVKTNAEACFNCGPMTRMPSANDRKSNTKMATSATCDSASNVRRAGFDDIGRWLELSQILSRRPRSFSMVCRPFDKPPGKRVSCKFDPLRPASCSCSKAGIFGTHEFAICPRIVSSILCCPAGLAKARGSRLPKGAACHAKLRDGDFDWMSARVWIFDLQPPYAAGVKDTGFYVAGRAVDRALRRWRAGQAELLDWHLAFVSELYLDGVVFDLGTDQGYRTGGLGQTSERSRHQK